MRVDLYVCVLLCAKIFSLKYAHVGIKSALAVAFPVLHTGSMRSFLTLLLGCLAVWGIAHFWPWRPLIHPPGVLIAEDPAQKDCPPRSLGEFKGYELTAVASYALRARVLRTKRYWIDGNDLVPYDVALGWGRMSDQAVLDRLHISQANRFFFYEWRDEPPIPENEIISHSSNNHVIAANPGVARVVSSLRSGQMVSMKGWLVNVSGPDGFHWLTSTRRDDTGNGACEVFYVESAIAGDEPGPAPVAPEPGKEGMPALSER
jgi:hypothetical protein